MARGIGAVIASELAAAGDQVAVQYSSAAIDAQGVVDSLAGSGHITVQSEPQDPDAIKAMVDSVAQEFDVIDVLINNAGVFFDHP